MKSPLEQFDIVNVKNFFIFFNDFSFNNIMVPFFILLFFFVILINILKNTKIISLMVQQIVELLYRFIVSIIKQQAGIKGFL
jgi:F0F1-type ATP synthase membrane subunit a